MSASRVISDASALIMYIRFHTDPSGTFMRYEAKAIGSGSEAAQSELQDKWNKVRNYTIAVHSQV